MLHWWCMLVIDHYLMYVVLSSIIQSIDQHLAFPLLRFPCPFLHHGSYINGWLILCSGLYLSFTQVVCIFMRWSRRLVASWYVVIESWLSGYSGSSVVIAGTRLIGFTFVNLSLCPKFFQWLCLSGSFGIYRVLKEMHLISQLYFEFWYLVFGWM